MSRPNLSSPSAAVGTQSQASCCGWRYSTYSTYCSASSPSSRPWSSSFLHSSAIRTCCRTSCAVAGWSVVRLKTVQTLLPAHTKTQNALRGARYSAHSTGRREMWRAVIEKTVRRVHWCALSPRT
eukprot:604663-Prymnesium_polylepis.1